MKSAVSIEKYEYYNTNHIIVVSYKSHHYMNEAKEVHLCMCLANQC